MKATKEEKAWLDSQLKLRRKSLAWQIEHSLSALRSYEAATHKYNACSHIWHTRVGTGDHEDTTQCVRCHVSDEHTPKLYAPMIERERRFLARYGVRAPMLTKKQWEAEQKRAKTIDLERQLAELKGK